jgi:hypothetical protein
MTRRPLLLASLMAAALLGAAPASAASLLVRGMVLKNCTIKVNDQGANINMASGASNLQVANISESCNADDGYTITLSSAFAGALANGTGLQTGYTMSYDNVAEGSLTNPLVINHTKDQSEPGGKEVSKALRVSVPGNAKAGAKNGHFYDTITISIAAR